MNDNAQWVLDRLAAKGELDAVMAAGWLKFARLSGGRPPTPHPTEINALIAEAEFITQHSKPGRLCRAEPPGETAGFPVICTLPDGHTKKIKHRDRNTGFAWWGEKK